MINYNSEGFVYQFLKLTIVKAIILSLFIYGITSLHLFNRYPIKPTVHFKLLTKIPVILCLVAFLLISTSIVKHESNFTYHITRFMLYTMMMLVSIWILDHRINLLIGTGDNRLEDASLKKQETNRRYYKSALPRATLLAYEEKVAHAINEERLYLNPSLDIKMMADYLHISKHHLSQVFSMQIRKTFNEYISEARIKHVCDVLKSNNNIIIEHLAYESGFNSKTSFYRHFKQHTGFTPSQYQENIKTKPVACIN
ncbi:AraC family transcriptional regulator [Olivibacter sp. SDN3]|uniref:AraC family transcriptional regulator n=1 Tax=Olivibacter sp. SDN3 TaxID=2764720 RepID=UPI001C9E5D0E|nr:AraC family transcriptional regulator [Olivibacter sp. SDN3]